MEIGKGLNEMPLEVAEVVLEPALLLREPFELVVLDLEENALGGDAGDINIEVMHK
jgi:hypothetical protein